MVTGKLGHAWYWCMVGACICAWDLGVSINDVVYYLDGGIGEVVGPEHFVLLNRLD